MQFLQYKRRIIVLIVFVLFVLWWLWLLDRDYSNGQEALWGVTFSKSQAEYLGLNWKQAYRATFDDLGVHFIRLVAPWNAIEKTPGVYDFTDLDWQMAEAEQRNARVILVIGRRVPRWPECHDPPWISNASDDVVHKQLDALITAIVLRYRTSSALVKWQVENEYFLTTFGKCPKGDAEQMMREIALVHILDHRRPILVTDSGELSSWRRTAPLGDFFGTTMYRIVWNRFTGYWRYTHIIPPFFYRLKARLVGMPIDRLVSVELQAEPWAPDGLLALQRGDRRQSFDAEQLREHIDFARRTGIHEHYFWGVEYWYWLREHGDSALWDVGRATISKNGKW